MTKHTDSNGHDDTSTSTPKTRKKRGEGAIQVWYDDGKTSQNTRVPPNAKAVVVMMKDKSHKVYQLDNLPPASLMNLALFGFGQRVKTFTSTHASKHSDMLAVVDALFTDLSSGAYYMRAEPKRGRAAKDRSIEINRFVEASKLTAKDQNAIGKKRTDGQPVQLMTKAQCERMHTKLTAMDTKEYNRLRNDYIANKATFKRHWYALLAAENDGAAKNEVGMDPLI
jgi:hypothetical protein